MTKEQQQLQKMIEDVLRFAKRNKVIVAGFAFSVNNPFVINFGNCTDAGDLRLYEKLVEMCDEKRNSGQSISSIVEEIN